MPVTLLAQELATDLGVDPVKAAVLLAVASEIATNYASEAPDIILNEAVRRISGWLNATTGGQGNVKSEAAGPFRIVYNTQQKSALRHSGAMALLSPYKIRRAAAFV